MGTLPREKKLAILEWSSVHVLNRGPTGIRSPVDELDPIHRGGAILIRINAVICCLTGGNQLNVKEMAGIRQGIPRCVIRTKTETSAS